MGFRSAQQASLGVFLLILLAFGCAEKVDSPAEFIQLAQLCERQGRPGDAITAYSSALTMEESPTTLIDRGSVLFGTGRVDEAISDYSRALELSPDSPSALANRAIAYMERRQLVNAIADCDRALEIDPLDAFAWRTRGTARHRNGDLAGAINDHTRCIHLVPTDPDSYVLRGNVYRDKLQPTKAMADYTRALELDDSTPGAAQSIAHLKTGLLPTPSLSDAVRHRLQSDGFVERDGSWFDSEGGAFHVVFRQPNANRIAFAAEEIETLRQANIMLILVVTNESGDVTKVLAPWNPEPESMHPDRYSMPIGK